MKPHSKKVKFNLYLLYEENDVMCIYDKDHMSELRIKDTSGSDPLVLYSLSVVHS